MALKRRQIAALRSKYLDERNTDRAFNSVDTQNLKISQINNEKQSESTPICQNGFKQSIVKQTANQTAKNSNFSGMDYPINLDNTSHHAKFD